MRESRREAEASSPLPVSPLPRMFLGKKCECLTAIAGYAHPPIGVPPSNSDDQLLTETTLPQHIRNRGASKPKETKVTR